MLARTFLNKKALASCAVKATTKQTARSYVVMMRQTANRMSAISSMGKDMHRMKANSMFKMPLRMFSNLPDHVKITMPSLSPTMEKGNLAKWCKKEGDEILVGDILAEIETDKATVDFEMQEDGYVAKLLVDEGAQDINLGDLVAIIVENEEDVAAFKDYKGDSGSPAPAKEETKAAPQESAPVPASSGSQAPSTPSRSQASGDHVNSVSGSGPGGRVIASDVQSHSPGSARAASHVQTAPVSSHYDDIPLTQMRKVIAQRLSESKETIPHYYVTVECEVDKLLALRAKLNNYSTSKISVNDMIIKASSLASVAVPQTNSSWQGEFIRQYKNVDMSVAVSTPKGLITPIIKNANVKGLQSISAEMKDLAERAREGKLKPEEFIGGTFSVSNLGMFGVSHFSAIINPPQACILAIGGAQKRVLPNTSESGEKYRVANVLSVTLSSDHRVVDGAEAAIWGQHFKKLIENPETMLL
jgi:pyruvate dehydrogenase E2 component (dihydrolipoamide acetyltransferase)